MFEDALKQSMYARYSDRTFLDKVLARHDVEAIRELIKKPTLTRGELLEMLYLISATESKLLNYSEYDRYVILKFFVWIREFVKVAELLYDYEDDLRAKENTCANCNKKMVNVKVSEGCVCINPKPKLYLSPRTKKLLSNNSRLIQHNAKFLVDLYLNIGRTSLSVGATGLLEVLKNKFEVDYRQPMQPQLEPKKHGLFKIGGRD